MGGDVQLVYIGWEPTITTVAIAVFIRDGEAEADDTKVYQGLYEEIDCKVTEKVALLVSLVQVFQIFRTESAIQIHWYPESLITAERSFQLLQDLVGRH